MNNPCHHDRRAFLQTLGAMTASIVVGAPEHSWAQPTAPFVRRDIGTLDPASREIEALRAGIAVMKSRPSTDMTSWSFQANMHGTTLSGHNGIWRQCQHGHWWFFPWHRMYLYYFERILRRAIQQSGAPLPADFALPYWNYSDMDAARTLPEILRARSYQPSMGGPQVPNPLFEIDRRGDVNAATNPTPLDPDTVSYSDAFTLNQFISSSFGYDGFGGQMVLTPSHQPHLNHGALESQPHDLVHDGIGGLMGDPDTAANDPVFWLHHCNIDRLWNRWLAQNMAANPDLNTTWGLQTFTFVDENGNTITQPVYKFLEYVVGNLIDYKYDSAPAAGPPTVPAPAAPVAALAPATPPPGHAAMNIAPVRPKRIASFPAPLHLTGKSLQLKIAVPEVHQRTLAAHAEGRAERPAELLLEVGGIDFNSLPRGGYYEIYLNLPENEQPSRKSKSYVGFLSTFALRQQAHAEAGNALRSGLFTFSITRVVKRLKEANAWSPAQLTVTFIPRELSPEEKNDNPRLTFRYVGVQEAEKAARP